MSFSMAMKASATSRNQMFALHAARYQLESLRTLSYTNSVLNTNTYPINVNTPTSGYYTVTANAYAGVKDVTVGIYYQNRLRGGVTTNTLTTSLSNTLHP